MTYQKSVKSEIEVSWASVLNDALQGDGGKLLDAYSAFHNYSLGNQLLAMYQCAERGMDISPIKTFNGWKSLGRSVKKGSKALYLCQPYQVKFNTTDKITGEDKEVILTRFKYPNSWFTLSQTDGDTYNPTDAIATNWDKFKALKELDIEEISFNSINGNTQGLSRIDDNKVSINPLAALPHKTMFHEMAHQLLHRVDKSDNVPDHKEREIEAECTALLCVTSLNLDGAEYSKGYIQHYAGKGYILSDDMANRIIKTADKILKAGKE